MTKNHAKTLVFKTLDILQLKKELMIMEVFTLWILCIYVLTKQMDILKKKMEPDISFLTQQMKIKSCRRV